MTRTAAPSKQPPTAANIADGHGEAPALATAAIVAKPAPSEAEVASLHEPRPLRNVYQDLRRHTFRSIGRDYGIDVSPDGGSLIFSGTQESEQPKIYLKEENSPLLRAVTTGGFRDLHPKFSPDGKWIAFASDREGNFDIWMARASSSTSLEQITASPEDELHPTFSPDAKQVAYCKYSEQQGWNIWVQHRERQSLVEIGPGLFPEWSPTGEWIAFQKASERGERWFGIWIVRPDGSEVRQVVAFDGWGAIHPTWSLEGNQIAFTTVAKGWERPAWDGRNAQGDDIWIVELKQGRLFQLTHHEGSNWSPVWGLNGRIYFASDRFGGGSIVSLVPPEVEG